MKLQLLPSTFDENGGASLRQHLACFVVDDCLAIDAGSLAMSTTPEQKNQIRDIILTHAHLDHIAGLPLFIDDMFSCLTTPVCVYATGEVIEILERDVFNWSVYPRFSELENESGPVLQYSRFQNGTEFNIKHLRIKSIEVNHKVPSVGFIISDGAATFAISGDTARTEKFWDAVNEEKNLNALLIECAFPDEMDELADASHHLTPKTLESELTNLKHKNCPIYAINLKPMFRERIVEQLSALKIEDLSVLEVGKIYQW
jgi:ribonuclease BN (tRNA processing enzyme)